MPIDYSCHPIAGVLKKASCRLLKKIQKLGAITRMKAESESGIRFSAFIIHLSKHMGLSAAC